MIDFNWTVFQQNIAILGMQGSGKTTWAKKILDSVPNSPRLIVSPQILLNIMALMVKKYLKSLKLKMMLQCFGQVTLANQLLREYLKL